MSWKVAARAIGARLDSNGRRYIYTSPNRYESGRPRAQENGLVQFLKSTGVIKKLYMYILRMRAMRLRA